MINNEFEAVVLAVLMRTAEPADATIADKAIDLFLARFGDDQVARMIAIRRLTTEILARDDHSETRTSPRPRTPQNH